MKKILALGFFGFSMVMSMHAHAYEVKHSYSNADGTTEYFGHCENGTRLNVVKRAEGQFSIRDGSRMYVTLDNAARDACGE